MLLKLYLCLSILKNSIVHKKGVLLVNLGSPDSTKIKDIKKYLDEDYFLENELPDAVLDIAEKRIAQEIKESYSGEPNPITAQVIEHALGEEGKIKEFRYWVHIEGVDFEGQNKHNTIKINDKRVLANVHKRI